MNHKNNKRSEQTKNKIKSTLIAMLNEQELEKITVRSLCENADINRSTFYNHYSSPKSVLRGMQKDFMSVLKSTLETARTDYKIENREQVLRTLFTEILIFIRDNLDVCRILNNYNLCPDFPNVLYNEPLVKDCFNQNVSERYSEENKEYLQQFVFHGSCHSLDLWMKKECDRSPEDMAALITSIISKF